MYDWRNMTDLQRQDVLAMRQQRGLPWHRLPHRAGEGGRYHLPAACYEHRPILGQSVARMAAFEATLIATVSAMGRAMAWCVLPNHYHALIETPDVLSVLAGIGAMHGRTSYEWNGEENSRGRKCWHSCSDRTMRSDRHQWATLNYVHHNPVHHRYVRHWQDWPFSSAARYLDDVGRETAMQYWRDYPVLDYGKGWDEPGM